MQNGVTHLCPRLSDFGKYITGHGWREGNLGDFHGAGDLDILNKPYTWEAPRMDSWLNNGTGVSNQSRRQGMEPPALLLYSSLSHRRLQRPRLQASQFHN